MNSLRAFVSRHAPESVRRLARRTLLGHPQISGVREIATVLDLYYWAADETIDTLLPLENFHSIFFPDLDTSTTAWIELYDEKGLLLGRLDDIKVPHLGTPGFRVSELLHRFNVGGVPYGNVIWRLQVPTAVAEHVRRHAPFMFWDRSYIAYVAKNDAIAFVHGIEKYEVVDRNDRRMPMPMPRQSFEASPELPVDLTDYPVLEVVQQNRAREPRHFKLTVTDRHGVEQSFEATVAASGVHRFVLDRERLKGLGTDQPLRLKVAGLPTRYGRPLVFKRFANGAIAAMHC